MVAFPPDGTKLGFEEDQVQFNIGAPPDAEKVIVPLSSPKQTTSVCKPEKTISVGSLMVREVSLVHPLASVIVTL